MSIAVTGALGFIGAAVVAELNNRELGDITLVDYPTPNRGSVEDQRWRNLSGLVFSDFVTPEEFNPAGHEVVFHLGADSSTGITFTRAMMDYNYSKELFRRTHSESTRIVYASSAGTYGIDGSCFDEDVWELRPRSPYALGKHMLDMYVDEHCKNVVGVKYSNVFGPGEYHKGKMASMIMQWHDMIKEGKKTPLFQPDDKFARDFIYVKDAARMTVDLGLNEKELSGVYNIGSGEATLFRDVLTMLYDLLDAEPKIEKVPLPEKLASQYQPYTNLSMQKAGRVIDTTTMDLQTAMFDYISYLNHSLRIGEAPCQQG
jgi:ADP-L-glycero-D-manno-heptose 6-epimerase